MDLSLLNDLSPSDRDKMITMLAVQRLQSKQDLNNWLNFFLDVDLADCVVSRFSTSTPLDMVWDIYQFCCDTTTEDPMTSMYVAGRASQKTLSAGVLQVLLPLHFKRCVVHFGGTKDQANRAYSYFKKFVSRPYIKNFLKDDPTQSKTSMIIDGVEVDVEILPLSLAAVQGSHAPVVSLDELSSLSPEKQLAYKDVHGVPSYTNEGLPWIRYGISSRKGSFTVIEQEYVKREETGMIFKFWTVLENTKRCPDSRSGTETAVYYGNVTENSKLTEDQYMNLTIQQKEKYERIVAKDKCFDCGLAVVCGGDLKKQTSTCRTLRPTASVVKEFKGSELGWFLSQKMSLQPSLEGLVFPKFKRHVFEKTAQELYTIFTGKPYDGYLPEELLIETLINGGCKCYAGMDHGYTDAAVVAIAYEDKVGNVYILTVETSTGFEPDETKEWVQRLAQKYKIDVLYPDTSAPALNKMLKKVVNVKDDFDKKYQIENGITLLRQKISPTGGGTKLHGLKGKVDFLSNELELYHYAIDAGGKYTDQPEDEFNHSVDACRYFAINRWKPNSSKILAPSYPEDTRTSDEVRVIQQQALINHNQNWLKNEIAKITGNPTTQEDERIKVGKGKSIIWDI